MTETDLHARIMAAAHHAYCHDTGCFDGDDIEHPELRQTVTDVLALVRAEGALAEHCFVKGKREGWLLAEVARLRKELGL